MASDTVSETSIQLENRRSRTSPRQSSEAQIPQGLVNEEPEEGGIAVQRLESADGGTAAWRLLFAAFIFESLMWGFPLSFGVFQNYYSQQPEFADNPYIPIVGTIASGISYLGAPIITPFIKRHPNYQRHMIWIGWPICILGLMAGSFATTLGALIITQGIMYGLGFVICYYPILNMVNEFWIVRRGMAYGVLCSASGVSGVVMPFILEALLNKYGYPTTLRAVGVALALLTGPLIPLLKGRLPPTEQGTAGRTEWAFLRKPLFWVYSTSNVFQGLGFFFPSIYLPSYATSIGLNAKQGALLLALMSVAQVLGQLTFGYLSDHRLPLWLLALLSTGVSAIAALTLWGLSQSLTPLILFAIIYGFFGSGYVSMWARMGTAVSDEPTAALATFSLFCFGKGLGNVLTGPISAGLLLRITNVGSYGAMRYKAVVIFTGACMILSAASIGAWYARPKRLRSI